MGSAQEPIAMSGVESSTVHSIGYDGRRRILAVRYKSGGLYYYKNVPKSIYNSLMGASSKGHFLAMHVRTQYTFVRQPDNT